MKKQLLFLFICAIISIKGLAQSISYTSVPQSTATGTNLIVSYKYTALTTGSVRLNISKNGGVDEFTYISNVAFIQTAAVVGTDITGTFTVPIPAATVPTANLTGNQNYRFKLELYNSSNVWVKGDYSIFGYNFTSSGVTPAISFTSLPSSTPVGTDLVIGYKYTIAAAGKARISVTKNGGAQPFTFISSVGFVELNPTGAGTDLTNTFTIPIPSTTTPTANLTGNENYRIKIELFKADDTFLVGDYSTINYNFTANSLGINDLNIKNSIAVYPNPVNAILQVANTDNLSNASYRIINASGQSIQNSKNLNSQSIDVSSLNSGVYILSIFSENENKQIKFIKQ